MRTHYDNLKVDRDAGRVAITTAFLRLRDIHDPQKYPEELRPRQKHIMQILLHSYKWLSSPILRAAHDRWIKSMKGFSVEPFPAYLMPNYDICNDFDFEYVRNAAIYTGPFVRFLLWCTGIVGGLILLVITVLMLTIANEQAILKNFNTAFEAACNSLEYPIVSGTMQINTPCYIYDKRNMVMELTTQTPRKYVNMTALRAVAAQSAASFFRDTAISAQACDMQVQLLGLNYMYKIIFPDSPPEYITIKLTDICQIVYSSDLQ